MIPAAAEAAATFASALLVATASAAANIPPRRVPRAKRGAGLFRAPSRATQLRLPQTFRRANAARDATEDQQRDHVRHCEQ